MKIRLSEKIKHSIKDIVNRNCNDMNFYKTWYSTLCYEIQNLTDIEHALSRDGYLYQHTTSFAIYFYAFDEENIYLQDIVFLENYQQRIGMQETFLCRIEYQKHYKTTTLCGARIHQDGMLWFYLSHRTRYVIGDIVEVSGTIVEIREKGITLLRPKIKHSNKIFETNSLSRNKMINENKYIVNVLDFMARLDKIK